jgi:alcohol dehydrogenase
VLSRLGEIVREHGKRALLVTGGGSVKRSGAFDRAVSSLKAAGISVAECSGVEPNQRLSSVVRGAQMARDEGCDVVIALSGGSTMDAAKVMAAADCYEGDPWDMMAYGEKVRRLPTRALPIITVPTLAATGSETNNGAVVTNQKMSVKSFVKAECLYPRVALVDPELTLSVPQDQTAFGVCDLITHVTESYFNVIDGTPLPANSADDADCAREGVDRFEAFLRSIGCPTRLSELGIGEGMLSRYAQDTLRVVHDETSRLPGRPPMSETEIVEVLRSAL